MRLAASVLTLFAATPSNAAPGFGEKVYGASVEAGVSELETRYSRLTGGSLNGEDVVVTELAHGFSERLYGAVVGEFGRDRGGGRRLDAAAAEGIFALGQIRPLGLDAAVYGEYEKAWDGPDKIETKLLLERARGRFDGRLNLIASRELRSGEPVRLGYAASADWRLVDEFRIGVAAFGDLGTVNRLLPRAQHFAGPAMKAAIEHLPGKGEFEIETGYLFALDAARDEARGQLRLLMEYEFRF